jgi:acetyl/propionyl-CoA carboxylase alpha subunit
MSNYEVKFQTNRTIGVSQKEGNYYIDGSELKIDQLKYENGFWLGIYKNVPFKICKLSSNSNGGQSWLINGKTVDLELKTELSMLLEKLGLDDMNAEDNKEIISPMPGLVLKVLVAEGDKIEKDQPVLVLESMKMENVLKAGADAVIQKISCSVGQTVEKNAILIEFE